MPQAGSSLNGVVETASAPDGIGSFLHAFFTLTLYFMIKQPLRGAFILDSGGHGMNNSKLETAPLAREVSISSTELAVHLKDGRTISAPLNWFPRLLNATPEQRAHFELLGEGEGIYWPDPDEDLSIAGILRGIPAPGA
jgi:hypothetical protein